VPGVLASTFLPKDLIQARRLTRLRRSVIGIYAVKVYQSRLQMPRQMFVGSYRPRLLMVVLEHHRP
jgi:hypothetical protein